MSVERIQVSVDGELSGVAELPIAIAAPGLFSADASGKGPGAIVNQDGTLNTALRPAQAESIVSLYGTGAGLLDRFVGFGYLTVTLPLGVIRNGVAVSIGDKIADVLYAGAAPSLLDGVFQLNVRIPGGTGTGAIPVRLTIGGVTANEVTVWVRKGGHRTPLW